MEATRDLSDADADDSENDDAFDHDLDALRRACLITGADPALLSPAAADAGDERLSNSDDDDDDLELVRSIRSRFAIPSDALESLSLMPLCSLPPDCSDADLADDDDFETLRAIQRRFAAYDNGDSLIFFFFFLVVNVQFRNFFNVQLWNSARFQ